MEHTKLSQHELKNVFTDVRRAYRLLYNYHDRIQDLARFIANRLEFHDFRLGRPLFSDPLQPKKIINNDRWTWDFLPGYCFDYLFADRVFQDRKYHLSILLVSDTGYYDNYEKVNHKIEESDFLPPERATSDLYLILRHPNTWNTLEKLLKDKSRLEEEGHLGEKDDPKLIYSQFSLDAFHNEASTRKCIEQFKRHCMMEHQIDLTPGALPDEGSTSEKG